MAIQFRRGNEEDFVADNLLPGEPAYMLDTGRLYIGGESGAKEFMSMAGGTITGSLNVAGALQQSGNNVWHAGNLPIADFVVEQGTSGYWTYRKWKSGLSEGWFRNSYASLSFGDETGSGALFQYARYNLTLALPISAAVFVESPRTVLAAASRGTSVYPFGAFVNTRSSTTVDVVLWSAIGGALPNVSVELYAAGRGK